MRNSITLTIFAFLFIMLFGCEKGEVPELKNPSIDYKDSALTEVASLQFFQSSIKVGETMDIELFSSLYRNISPSNIEIRVGSTKAIVNTFSTTNNGKKYLMNITIPTVITGLYDLKAVLTTDNGSIELRAADKLSVQAINTKTIYLSRIDFTALTPKQSAAFSTNYTLRLKDLGTGDIVAVSSPHTWSWNGNQWTNLAQSWAPASSIQLTKYQTTGYQIELYEGSVYRSAIPLDVKTLTQSITSKDFASSGQLLDFAFTATFEWK